MDSIDWKNLPFQYSKTDYNVRTNFKNGEWGQLEEYSSEFVRLHMASTCMHYGQEAFEGLKAYSGKDGTVRLFRYDENWKRLKNSAKGLLMEHPPFELFEEAILKAVKINKKYIPPYGTGATLYIRPLVLGLGEVVGVSAANEYMFLVFVTPVGPYFKSGFNPVDMVICREYDRAAPMGTGCFKVGGNYAASLKSLDIAHGQGYATALYLDSKEKKYIDEAGPANFFGIKNNTYITPKSNSILPSITNMSLMALAEDMGLKVERRQVAIEELETFDEVGACGTAAVITPIRKIVDADNNKFYSFSDDGKPGPISTQLYNRITAIQFGEEEDKFGWTTIVENI